MLRVAEAVQRTDTGRQREANEDSYFARAPVFAVADGMGGAQAGEVASRIAVEAFEPERDERMPPERYLTETAKSANRSIFELAQGDRSRSGMGTTLTAAVVGDGDVAIGHVGDSRAYRFRDGELAQLTNDHSLVEELRRQGKLTPDQAAEHPQRSVITRALGPEPDVAVDTMTVAARDGDLFVLCSDGLTTMLGDEEITTILAQGESLDAAARGLVREANERGGRDNITVVLFRVEDAGGAAPVEDATLIGPTAETEGFDSKTIREAVSEERARTGATAAPPPAPRQREPLAEAAAPERPRPRRRRRLLLALGAVAVLAVLAGAATYGARQVWFLGTDEAGRVSLFRGLPYELPFGVDLYDRQHAIPFTVDALPEERRAAVTDHELRSREDAIDLLDDLQRAAEQASRPLARSGTSAGGGGSGGGGGTSP